MRNSSLKRDVRDFLDKYLKFSINGKKSSSDHLVLDGNIDIVDTMNIFWDSYEVRLVVPITNYPNVIPIVYEISSKIERDIDFHISKKGECCLEIHHQLSLEKRKGISLVDFYRKYIYPFFANHQYKLRTKSYAGEEYAHGNEGVVQFYNESFQLTDFNLIVKHIECALGILKAERNKKCPICGGSKYKKCCGSTVEELKRFGKKILQEDLTIFRSKLLEKRT